jgi:alanyl-tRNA synthetase
MAEQKAKARAAWSGSGEQPDAAIWFDLAEGHGSTEFLGYDTEKAEGVILALVKGGERSRHGENRVTRSPSSSTRRPFYAEAGGQVGDTGTVKTENGARSPTPRRWRACSCILPSHRG